MAKRVCLLLFLVAAPLLAVALDATVTFVKPDGSGAQIPEKITLPGDGACTDCIGLEGGAVQLKAKGSGNATLTPVLVEVAGAPTGTAVAFVGYGATNCTGANQTSYFTDFQAGSVTVSTDSDFPSSIQSFALCQGTTGAGGGGSGK